MIQITIPLLYPYMLTFSRLFPLFMLLPGIGEKSIPGRIRLLIALVLSISLTPTLESQNMFEFNSIFILSILTEALIGLFIGLLIRTLFLLLEVTGSILSNQIGFSTAMAFNPSLSEQTSILSTVLMLFATLIIFTSDIHHFFLRFIFMHYDRFNLSSYPPESLVDIFTYIFISGFKQSVFWAIPIILINLLFYLSVGLLNRFIPQVQIFFISLPVQVFVGLTALTLIIGVILENFGRYFIKHLHLIFEAF